MGSMTKCAALWLLLVALLPIPADAHGTHLASAKVVERDQHLRIELFADPVAYVARHAPTRPGTAAPLPAMLSVFPDEVLGPMVASAEQEFRAGLRIELDGQPVPVARVAFPSPAALRRAAGQAGGDEVDAPPIVAEVRLPRESGTVTLGFEAELGPVLVSHSRPRVQLARAGAGVALTVGPLVAAESSAGWLLLPICGLLLALLSFGRRAV